MGYLPYQLVSQISSINPWGHLGYQPIHPSFRLPPACRSTGFEGLQVELCWLMVLKENNNQQQKQLNQTKNAEEKCWTLRIIGPSYRGVWPCIAGFWDLQTTSFEIPWFLGRVNLWSCWAVFCWRRKVGMWILNICWLHVFFFLQGHKTGTCECFFRLFTLQSKVEIQIIQLVKI